MYRGKNPTALKSQQWVKDAFFELLEEKPYDKINVKEITKRADLARQTFYKLYAGKDEILEHKLDEMYGEFKEKLLEHECIDIKTLAYCYFEFFYEHRDFVSMMIKNNLVHFLDNKFSYYLNEIKSLISHKNKEHSTYINSMISGALLGILIQWFNDGLAAEIDDLAVLVSDVFTGVLIAEN